MNKPRHLNSVSRRAFLAKSGLVAGAASLAAQEMTGQQALAADGPSGPFRLLSAPVLTNPAPDGVSVLWATSAPATGWIEFGETEHLGQRATGEDQGLLPFDDRAFKVRLSGLMPGTRYFYRVHAVQVDFRDAYTIRRQEQTPVASQVFSFTTPDPAAAAASFTVWNDTHEQPETLRRLHDAHVKDHGDFLLWNGDVTNDIYGEEKMIGQFLAPAALPFAAATPYHFVRGNHDVRGPAARRLARFTDVPEGRYFYSFCQGPLAVIVLDTGEDKPDNHGVYGGLNAFAAFRARQAEWLSQEIERPEFRAAPFRVLFCHIPLWWKDDSAVGDYCADGRARWHDLLVRGGVQLVISGHTHEAAWLPADAARPYGQLIGGGPEPKAATYIRGHATTERLTLTQHRLTGESLHRVELTA